MIGECGIMYNGSVVLGMMGDQYDAECSIRYDRECGIRYDAGVWY